MPTKIQVRRATAAQWAAANPVLASGEFGLETDTKLLKIGDGTTVWNALSVLFDDVYEPFDPSQTVASAVRLPGTTGNYISTPDTDAVSLSGTLTALRLPGLTGAYASAPDSDGLSIGKNRLTANQAGLETNLTGWLDGGNSVISRAQNGTLRLPGVAGNDATTPDSVAISVVGDIDVRVKATMDNWVPTVDSGFLGKWGNAGDRCYTFYLQLTDGRPILAFTTDGTTQKFAVASVATGLAAGTTKWLRATRVATTGVVLFYMSDDGITWVQLGTAASEATTGSLWDSAVSTLHVGAGGDSRAMQGGYLHYAEVRDGINGVVVAAFDATTAAPTTTRLPVAVTQGNANLITNSGFETDVVGWGGGNATVARSTAAGTFLDGVASMAVTADAAAAGAGWMTASTPGETITAGLTYSFMAHIKAATTPRSVVVKLSWFTAGWVGLGQTTGTSVVDSTTGWVTASVTGVAPPTAAIVQKQVVPSGAIPEGEVHYMDRIMMWQSMTTNLLTENQANAEIDTAQFVSSTGSPTLAISTAQALDGASSLSVTATSTGDMAARTAEAFGVAPVAGKTYTAKVNVRAATVARGVTLFLDWIGGVGGSVQNSSADTTTGWTEITVSGVAPAGVTGARVRAYWASAVTGEVHYMDRLGLYEGTQVTGPTNLQTPWTLNGTLWSWPIAAAGRASLGMHALTAATHYAVTPQFASGFPVVGGRTYTLTGQIRAGSVARTVGFYFQWFDSGGTTIAPGHSIFLNTSVTTSWLPLTLTAVAPTNAVTCSILVQTISPTAIGETTYIDSMSVVEGSQDLDIRVKVAMDDWTPSSVQTLVGKYTAPNTSWLFQVQPSGTLTFYSSANGTTNIQRSSTAAVGFSNGATKWVRATLDVDNGAVGNDVKFYTSDDAITWTQLGTTITTAGVTSIFDSTNPVTLGQYGVSGGDPLTGTVYAIEIRNGIDGDKVANPDFTIAPWVANDTAAAARADTTGNTWTLAGNAKIYYQSERRSLRLSGVNGVYASTPDSPALSLAGVNVLDLPGIDGTVASTPDSAATSITGDIDIRVKVALDNWAISGVFQTMIAKFQESGNQMSYALRTDTVGNLELLSTTGGDWGTSSGVASSATVMSAGAVNGQPIWVRVTRDVDDGSGNRVTIFYTSSDGVAWTQLGITRTQAGVAAFFDSTAALTIGSQSVTGHHVRGGIVYYAEVRNGIAGTVVAKFDPSTISPTADNTPTTLVATTGETWTMAGTRWNWRKDNEVRSLRLPGTIGAYASTPDSAALSLAGNNVLRLPGVSGSYVTTPDTAANSILGDIDLRVKLTPDSWGQAGGPTLIGKQAGGVKSYSLVLQTGSTRKLLFIWSVDGVNWSGGGQISTVVLPFTDGQTGWVRVTLAVATGTTTFYTSTDGITWTPLGTPLVSGATSIADSTAAVELGSANGGTGNLLIGTIHYAEIRNGIAGTVVVKFDPSTIFPTVDQTPTTLVASTGETWTVNGTKWNWRKDNEVRSLRIPATVGAYANTPDSSLVSLAGNTVLRLPGTTGSYTTTPDSAAASITGDIDIRVKLTADDWSTGLNQSLVSKRDYAGGGLGAYRLNLTAGGNLDFTRWTSSVASTGVSTVIAPFVNGMPGWVRATYANATGEVNFYTSTDGVTWTPLGSMVTIVAGLIDDTTAPVNVGGLSFGPQLFAGTIHYVEIRNGIAGTVVVKFDPSTISPTVDQTPTTLVATTGETWTMNGTRWNWRRDNEVRSLRLNGTVGVNATTPDSAALSITGDFDLRVKMSSDDWTPATEKGLLGKWTAGQQSYLLSLDSDGKLRLYVSADGSSSPGATSTVVAGVLDGAVKWVRATYRLSDRRVQFFLSDDGFAWTQLGADVIHTAASIYNGTGGVELGSWGAGSVSTVLFGNIYYAEIRNNILNDGTGIVANPSFENQPWDVGDTGASTGTDDAGNTWTLNGAAAIRRVFNIDIDLRVKVNLDNWTPTGFNPFIIQKAGAYFLRVLAAGHLQLAWYGYQYDIFKSAASTVVTGIANGGTKWIRATLDVDDGAGNYVVKFYLSDDGIAWTQLGATVTVAGTTAIADSNSALDVGMDISANALSGHIYAADIRKNILNDGTGIIANPSFENQPWDVGDTAAATGVDGAGNTWTIAGTAIIRRGFAADLDVRVKVAVDNWAGTGLYQGLVSKMSGSLDRSWSFELNTTSGFLFTQMMPTGLIANTIQSTSSAAVPFIAQQTGWVRWTMQSNNGSGVWETKFYTSTDGITWNQLGVTRNGTTTAYFADSPDVLEIGSRNAGQSDSLFGNVQYVEVRNGINGVVVANPDFTAQPWDVGDTGAATGTDIAGNTWTLQGTAKINRAFAQDLDIRVKVALDDWLVAPGKALISKWDSGSGRSYQLTMGASGNTPSFQHSPIGTGSIPTSNATASLSFANGAAGWLRVTLDVDNGAGGHTVTFYTSTDGATWTPLGSPIITAGVTAIFDSDVALALGTSQGTGGGTINVLTGNFHYAEVRKGIDGPVLANPNFTDMPWVVGDTGAAAKADVAGNTWTLQGAAIINRAFASDLDIRAKLSMDNWGTAGAQSIVSKYGTGNVSYLFDILSGGLLRFLWSANGKQLVTLGSTVGVGLAVGAIKWVRVTFDADNGAGGSDAKFYLSDNGVTWTQLGTTVTYGSTTTIWDGTMALQIGAHSDPGNHLAGIVSYAEIRNGINGVMVARFAPANVVPTGIRTPTTVYDPPTTVLWTMNGSAWSWVSE